MCIIINTQRSVQRLTTNTKKNNLKGEIVSTGKHRHNIQLPVVQTLYTQLGRTQI